MEKYRESKHASENDYVECEKHGKYLQSRWDRDRWVSVNPWCPKCKEESKAKSLLRRAAIPPRFARCSLDSYLISCPGQQTALDVAKDYASNFQKLHGQGVCMVMRGHSGTGKNHLAIGIARSIGEQGYTSCLLTVSELISRVRATWTRQAKESGESDEDVIRKFAAVDLLILDEIGRQHGSESEKLTIFQVIDARYRLLLPTILITNLMAEQIPDFIGMAAYDRLREGGGRLINFEWKSFRN